MITRRTLLLYNFGIAALLVFIGLLSMVGADASQIKRLNDLPNFVTDRTALYAGYRFQHISNANTDSPNRGINSHTGVVGLSILFP